MNFILNPFNMKNLCSVVLPVAMVLALMACGGNKNNEDYYDSEYQIEGNPEKVVFLEDFYEKYMSNLNDQDALSNFVSDLITDRTAEIVKRISEGKEDMLYKIFKPAAIDSIGEDEQLEPVFVTLHDNNEEGKDNLYNVQITDLRGNLHDIAISVTGSNGEFKIDSIFNPDYCKAEQAEEENPKENDKE